MAKRKKSSSKSEAGDVSRSGSMPDLTIEQVGRTYRDASGGFVSRMEWAVVSSEEQEPLTEAQATEILVAYKALQIVAPGVTRLDVKPAKPSRKRR
jgi:hypothetical protein